MACNSCESSGRFRASYCDDCERWTFHVDKRDLLIAAGLLAVGAVGCASAGDCSSRPPASCSRKRAIGASSRKIPRAQRGTCTSSSFSPSGSVKNTA